MRNWWIGLAAVLVFAACGGGDDEPAESGAAPEGTTTTTAMAGHGDMHAEATDCSPSGSSLSIVAKDTAFDKNCLAAPADQDLDVTLDNQDTTPHNLVLLESHTATDVFGRIEIFPGPKRESMKVARLSAGTYAFHCEVHPNRMSGTFVVK